MDREPYFIIGNLVIPVTDEIQAKLKGDYSMDKLKKVFPAVFDRPCIHFLEGSIMCVDSKHFNFALAKISAYHKQMGDIVEWYDPMFGEVMDCKKYLEDYFKIEL